jgi:hypothetical protein
MFGILKNREKMGMNGKILSFATMAFVSLVQADFSAHKLTPDIEHILQRNEAAILMKLRTSCPKIATIDDLPGYIIKTNISRVAGADRVRVQLIELFEVTGYVDFYKDNLIPLTDGVLALIDTELKSFRDLRVESSQYLLIKFGVLVQLSQLPFDAESKAILKVFMTVSNPFAKEVPKIIIDWDLVRQILTVDA